jgi:hypothetical protein
MLLQWQIGGALTVTWPQIGAQRASFNSAQMAFGMARAPTDTRSFLPLS